LQRILLLSRRRPADYSTDKIFHSRLVLISLRNCLFLYDSGTPNESLSQWPAKLQSQGRLEVRSLVDNLRYGAEALTVEDRPFTPSILKEVEGSSLRPPRMALLTASESYGGTILQHPETDWVLF